MTTSALVMLVVTWLIVGGLALRFFLMVLRTPMDSDASDEGEPQGEASPRPGPPPSVPPPRRAD